LNFSIKTKIDLQLEITRHIYTQLKRLNNNGTNLLMNCPTIFDAKDSIIKLILGLLTISESMTNVFSLINKIISVNCCFIFFIDYSLNSILILGNEYDNK